MVALRNPRHLAPILSPPLYTVQIARKVNQGDEEMKWILL